VALATLEEYLNNFQSATRSIVAAHERLADEPFSGGRYTENGSMEEKQQAQRKVGQSSQADTSRESPAKTKQQKKQRLSFEEFQSRFGIGLEEDETLDPKAASKHSDLRDSTLATADRDNLSTAVDSGFVHPGNFANDLQHAEGIFEANQASSPSQRTGRRKLDLHEEASSDKRNLEDDQNSSSSIRLGDTRKSKEVGDMITFDATPGTMFTYGANDVILAEVMRSIQPTAKFIFFSTASNSLVSGTKSNEDVSFPQMSRLWNEFTAKLRRMRAIKSRSLEERPHPSSVDQTTIPTTPDALLPEWLWSSTPSVDSSEVTQASATRLSAIVLSFVESVETSLEIWDECRSYNNDQPDLTANASGTTSAGSSTWRSNITTQIGEATNTAAQCLKALTAGQQLYKFKYADSGHDVQEFASSLPSS